MNEKIVEHIRGWKELDGKSASLIEETIARCDHPVVCTVMEIIRRDAELHSRVLELIVESMERKPLTMSLDQFGEVVGLIQQHFEVKEKMVKATEESLAVAKDKSLGIQRFLLTYVLEDERKHQAMLQGIERVKRTLYPYWPH
jgi:hypothetical protein